MHRLDYRPSVEEMQMLRNVFGSKEGPAVLRILLFVMGYDNFDGEDTPESSALRTMATWILCQLGGGRISGEAIKDHIRRLIKEPLPEEQKE